MLSAGQILDGRYEITSLIAAGGMGEVYRARRRLLLDEVAIKVIRTDPANPAVRERFMRESRACARLRHPNIVSILDFDIDASGTPFLVMELLSGPSVKDEIAARGRLDVADVVRIVPSLCAALQLAHRGGIVHRDLKPANLVRHDFSSGEHAYKIVDFGIANIRESTDDTRLTGADQFLGTIAYASPEQLGGGIVDARSDVYSLGAVVFEMLTGRPPFAAESAMAVVSAHFSAPVPRPSELRPGLPPWIDLVVTRALAKRPEDRWATIGEFGAALGGDEGHTTVATAVRGGARPMAALLGTYDIGDLIGPGRLGSEVYHGVHRALGHPVAIRLLRPVAHRNWEGIRARFLREARTMQLAHPSIIQVRDYGEEGELVYVVTDFIEGASLRELMDAVGPIAWPRLRPMLVELLDAARALHRRNGLLCGLTPDIMRVAAPEPADDGEGERLMISTAGIWQAQDLLATLQEQTLRGLGLADAELRYVAPELMTGQAADVRSDVFTMGVLAYEMATGTLPYDGPSMPALLGAMLKGSPANPGERQPTLPDVASAALLRALSPSPFDRFATAKEFAAALLGSG